MQEIRAKQVLGYVFLPGILPRAKSLFGSGFGFLAFLMATILHATRLLPATHPYLRPANIGKFSIRSVFAQAGQQLVFDRKHLDQIVIFFTLIVGFVLLVLQFVFLAVSLIINPVLAAGGGGGSVGLFTTENPQKDIAFILMDKVFGVPGFFNSDYAPTGSPLPFHQALQGLFQFYSTALLLVGVIIFLYYIMVIIVETAQTGTPFGRRFNHLWAPIRLVVALGLLVPINYGLNSGQYIVLMAAKMGSGFATNGWLLFNESMSNALGVDDNTLYARPKVPDSWPLVKFMTLATTCKIAYERVGVKDIHAYLVKGPNRAERVATGEYDKALNFYDQGDVIIRFGQQDTKKHSGRPAGVEPYCGEIILHTTARTNTGTNVGPYNVQQYYFNETMLLWEKFAVDFGTIMSYRILANKSAGCTLLDTSYFPATACDLSGPGPAIADLALFRDEEQASGFEVAVRQAREEMTSSGSLAIPQEILDRGWGGAGIWYNRIAEMNGAFFSAVNYLPSPTLLPRPMITVMEDNKKANTNVSSKAMFSPHRADGSSAVDDKDDLEVAKVLYNAYQTLGSDELFVAKSQSKNYFRDTLSLLLGLNGLFTMRENTDIHPLAQLVGLGKGIVDASIRNMFAATFLSAASSAFPDTPALGLISKIGTGIFTTLAMMGLTIGFILYYVLPFMPFMYFFFAVGNWLKTVFEAMIGAPLWALAHLRIDGDGLPGEAAMTGYLLVFEIFLRPILTVFGLIGSLIIFAALVKVLNEIFTLVTSNLAGFDNNPCKISTPGGECSLGASIQNNSGIKTDTDNEIVKEVLKFKRDTIDEFFFTILYTMIVYMMANSSFKMIDLVPQKILRWMGGGAQAFGEGAEDLTGEMKRYVAAGGMMMTNQLVNAATGAGGKIGQGAKELLNPKPQGANVSGTGGGPPTP